MRNRHTPTRLFALSIILFTLSTPGTVLALPSITGKFVIDAPPMLAWPTDRPMSEPELNDSTADTVFDLHGQIDECELMLSTEGNYHPALHDIWPIFLAKFKNHPLKNWIYTTSPPVVLQQLAAGQLRFGNFTTDCRPSVAVASKRIIDKLIAAGNVEGDVLPLYVNRGSVILVKHGNPKRILTVWDLGRNDVHVVTPNPLREQEAFTDYAETIYGIASHDTRAPAGQTADTLFNSIFNSKAQGKWLAGEHIHHRDIAWSIAYGHADAAVIFSQLARYIKASFPDKFDIVPLGGTIDDPQPLPGSKISIGYLVRIKGVWSPRQREAREKLIDTLQSETFTKILQRRGLERPDQSLLKAAWAGRPAS